MPTRFPRNCEIISGTYNCFRWIDTLRFRTVGFGYFLYICYILFMLFRIGLIITGDIVQLRSGELAINALHISERSSRVFNVPQHLSSCFLLLSISKVIPAGVVLFLWKYQLRMWGEKIGFSPLENFPVADERSSDIIEQWWPL